MNFMPHISVLMPVHNGGKYLKEAIDSILSQSFRDFEFLIINDGSTDSTEEIINSYTDPRIKYFDNGSNRGLIFSLNRGIDLAKGEFIARMDADDISHPNRFEKQIELFEKNPELGVCSTWFEFFGGKGGIKKFPPDHEEIYLRSLLSVQVGHPNSMIRSRLFSKFNIRYDPGFRYSEDSNLWIKLMQHTRFANIPESLYRYRLHSTQITRIHSHLVRKSFQRSANIHFKNILKLFSITNDQAFELYPSGEINLENLRKFEEISKELIRINNGNTYLKKNILESVILQLWKNKLSQLRISTGRKLPRLFWCDFYNHVDFPFPKRIKFFVRML